MRLVALFILAAAAAGCGEGREIEAAKALVAGGLLDPDSAQFRNVEHHPENGAVCGEVNAKNRYGGYVGFAEFFVVGEEASVAPASGVAITDVDLLNSAVEQSRFALARLEACSSEPLRMRLSEN